MKQNCPVCESTSLKILLERTHVPVHQNVLFDTQKDAKSISRGDLYITICMDCSFVFNAAFSSKLMNYDQDYENTQSYSEVFEEYIDHSIDYLVRERGLSNSKIVEVGCGKGLFLKKLVIVGNNIGVGFDPSYVGPLTDISGKLTFYKEFFDEKSVDISPDFIVCRHVIEHIEEPVKILESIRQAVKNSEKVYVFFETPDVDWIFENEVVWDFFYEHCSLFNKNSIKVAFQKAGFHTSTVKKIFGTQYLWVEAHPSSIRDEQNKLEIGNTLQLAENFQKTSLHIAKDWQERLHFLSQGAKLILWGAGAKGVTFANLFDPQIELIECVVDVNPNKQGKYLAGTGHLIVSPSEIRHTYSNGPLIILVLNPNYKDEVINILRENDIDKYRLVEFSTRN